MADARVLVGSVAYPDLRDHSAALLVVERLAQRIGGGDVVVEDASYNPVAVVQMLQAARPEDAFGRVVLVASPPRGGGPPVSKVEPAAGQVHGGNGHRDGMPRAPGTVTAYRWDGVLPDAEEVHRAVCDAVTGVIHVDNTLIVGRQFGGLPEHVFVVEIEPLVHDFGDALSAEVAAAIEPACALVARIATDAAFAATLPVAPLGGGDAAVGLHAS